MALKEILQQIDELKAQADALRPVDPKRLKVLNDKLRLEWDYNSNAIEGNTLTKSETRMLILHGYHTGNKLGRHYEEMKLHDDVLLTLEELVRNNEPITEVLIRGLHHQMMGDEYFVRAYDSLGNPVNVKGRPGEYKDRVNGVERIVNRKKVFVPFKSPDEVRIEMPELINWYRKEEEQKKMHPVELAAEFHFRFVTLHPFDDGNGRMSRILMNMILMRNGYVPAIITVEEREQYIYALALAQDGGSIEPFIDIVAKDTQHSLSLLIKAARGESIEEPGDLDKKITLLEKEIEVVSGDNIKSNKTMLLLWQSSLFPFIEKYLLKFASFRKLFKSADVNISYQIGIRGIAATPETLDKWFREPDSERESVPQIHIQYSFFDLKNLHFDIRNVLHIAFQSGKYSCRINNRELERKYNQFLSEEEIEKFIEDSANDFLALIKSEIDKSNF